LGLCAALAPDGFFSPLGAHSGSGENLAQQTGRQLRVKRELTGKYLLGVELRDAMGGAQKVWSGHQLGS
jgi:hypothetical protein